MDATAEERVIEIEWVSSNDEETEPGQWDFAFAVAPPEHLDSDDSRTTLEDFPFNRRRKLLIEATTADHPLSLEEDNSERAVSVVDLFATKVARLAAKIIPQKKKKTLLPEDQTTEEPQDDPFALLVAWYPLETLGVVAPCKAWLRAQQNYSGPEIFDAFFQHGTMDAIALLRVSRRFFSKQKDKVITLGGRVYVLFDDDDDQMKKQMSKKIFLYVDRRRRPTTTTVPKHAKHVVCQFAKNIARGWDREKGNNVLETLWLPSAETIDDFAFDSCLRLRSVASPAAREVRTHAFANNPQLSIVSLPRCRDVGPSAFHECHRLTRADLPSCNHIREGAFLGCRSLQTAVLPAAHTVHADAFFNCPRLRHIEICSFTNLKDRAFHLPDIHLGSDK